MDSEAILRVLMRVSEGHMPPEAALHALAEAGSPTGAAATRRTEDACVDLDREARCGFAEVVYGEGKTADSIAAIFRALQARGQDCLATRVSPIQAESLLQEFPDAEHNPLARTLRLDVSKLGERAGTGRVRVLAAGTTDRPIAEEALETLRWMRVPCTLILDIGVAGPQRLQSHLSELTDAAAIVVVAGMEGALPSVVGGHVACPVIGVPTSVGYGANFGGLSALLSILNSCAANVTTVNIDAGFKGGYIAGLIAHRTTSPS